MSVLEKVIALAFERAPAQEANQAIERVRVARAQSGREATSYEIALPALDPDAFLLHKSLPKLVYFLHCRGLVPGPTPGLFVSLFTTQGLAFVDAGELALLLGQERGLDGPELVRRYGADGAGEPKALGG
jgi:hypothetical protein